MKKRRLKSFVLPTIYILIILVTFFSVSIINNQLLKNVTNYDYSKSLMKDVTQAKKYKLNQVIIVKIMILKNKQMH